MKLIDILVQELPKRGGWPDGVAEIWQDYDGLIRPGKFGWLHNQIAEDHRRKHEDANVKINRRQYEAALSASGTGRAGSSVELKAEWNGEGLPPVGCECELNVSVEFYTHSGSADFDEGTAVIVGGVVNFGLGDFCAVKVKGTNVITDVNPTFLRPIRSEADRKRDEAVGAMLNAQSYGGQDIYCDIYDAIAAGKIPGIRIE